MDGCVARGQVLALYLGMAYQPQQDMLVMPPLPCSSKTVNPAGLHPPGHHSQCTVDFTWTTTSQRGRVSSRGGAANAFLGGLLKEFASDEHAPNLGRARTDLIQLGVAQQTARRILVDVAVAAQDLNGLHDRRVA